MNEEKSHSEYGRQHPKAWRAAGDREGTGICTLVSSLADVLICLVLYFLWLLPPLTTSAMNTNFLVTPPQGSRILVSA